MGVKRRLDVREETLQSGHVGRVDHNSTVQTLLALALLLEKVAATVAFHGKRTGSSPTDSLLRAAV